MWTDVGVDLVELKRIERLVEGRETIFRNRILGQTECEEIREAYPVARRTREYACSVAAKEALLKALGTGLQRGMRWPDIQVRNRTSARPSLAISGRVLERLSGLNVGSIHLALGFNRRYALATVVLARNCVNEMETR